MLSTRSSIQKKNWNLYMGGGVNYWIHEPLVYRPTTTPTFLYHPISTLCLPRDDAKCKPMLQTYDRMTRLLATKSPQPKKKQCKKQTRWPWLPWLRTLSVTSLSPGLALRCITGALHATFYCYSEVARKVTKRLVLKIWAWAVKMTSLASTVLVSFFGYQTSMSMQNFKSIQ